MDEPSGKISFGFSKISKKQILSTPKSTIVKKIDQIQYIDSLENNSFKVINEEKPIEKQALIIPLQNPNLLKESMIEAVRSRTEKVSSETETLKKEVSIDNGTEDLKKETLDEMAAREIIEDINKVNSEKKDPIVFSVPLAEISRGGEESNLDDYNNVPISDFGLAMLRGMGWKPEKGIGKNEKVVKVEQPSLRPKGMGLGADKVIKTQKPVAVNNTEDTVLKKESKVRITYGRCKNMYGIVQAFDDDSSRISVKLSVGNETVEINQCFIQLVSPDEFNKYSKVLNINTYSKFQENELKKDLCQSSNDKKELSKKTLSNVNRNSYEEPVNRKYKKCSSDTDSEQERRIKNNYVKGQKSSTILISSSESDSGSEQHYKRTKDKYKSKERHKRYSDSESSDSDEVESRYKNKSKKKEEYKPKERHGKYSHPDDSDESGKKYHKSFKNVSKSREDQKKYLRYSISDDSSEDYKKNSKSDKKEKDRKHCKSHRKSSKSDSNKHKKSKKKKKHRSRSRSVQRNKERRK